MLKQLRLSIIKRLLFKKDISTILISLGITKEEYIKRYNNPNHVGYKSDLLKNTMKDINRLEEDFALMLNIKNYHIVLKNTDYLEIMSR